MPERKHPGTRREGSAPGCKARVIHRDDNAGRAATVAAARYVISFTSRAPHRHTYSCRVCRQASSRFSNWLQVVLTLAQTMQQAGAAYNRRDWAEAERLCRMVLDTDPEFFAALNLLGIIAAQSGHPADAADLLGRAAAVEPQNPGALFNYGNILRDIGRLDEALAAFDRVLELRNDIPEAHAARGLTLHLLGRYDEAIRSDDHAIRLRQDFVEAHFHRALSLRAAGDLTGAVAAYDRVVALRSDHGAAWNNRAVALQQLGKFAESVESCDRAVAINGDHAEAWFNRGLGLKSLKRLDDAIASYDRAVAARPDYAKAWSNRGIALAEAKRLDDAVASCDRAIAIDAGLAEAHYNRGIALAELQRFDEAVASYERTLALKPDCEFLEGNLLQTVCRVCDWSSLAERLDRLRQHIDAEQAVTPPFPALALFDDPGLHRKAAAAWAGARCSANGELGALAARSPGKRIHVGYFSADLHDHATAHLMAGLFEAHDRDRFEFTAFSFGPDTGDAMRGRLRAAFDRFLDVRTAADIDVARRARELGIDIAVDLKGYTQDARTEIFAYRCAPVQVNYLGYPGTMGVDYMDYIVADATLIPADAAGHYAEKVVRLPGSYQVNDRDRVISDRVFTRRELGLPENGFVYCCFNNSYKIMPETFDVWMRILGAVEGSVLWLLDDNAAARRNLCREADRRGIDPGRLVFAPRMSTPEHLARQRAADLFLDTLPYNAHTTASDALWAGLPVLTRIGQGFAGRVAASLLRACGLPELVTDTRESYEALAIGLGKDSERLGGIRRKLAENRLSTPLFDTTAFARAIESAYIVMHERAANGIAPADIGME